MKWKWKCLGYLGERKEADEGVGWAEYRQINRGNERRGWERKSVTVEYRYRADEHCRGAFPFHRLLIQCTASLCALCIHTHTHTHISRALISSQIALPILLLSVLSVPPSHTLVHVPRRTHTFQGLWISVPYVDYYTVAALCLYVIVYDECGKGSNVGQ